MSVFPSSTAAVAGVPFEVTDLPTAAGWMLAQSAGPDRRGIAVRLANAYSVTTANDDPAYLELLQNGGVNFPDGAPVAWAMRRAGEQSADRVRGPSLFTEVLDRSQRTGVRHYFFGTDDAVLEKLVARVRALYPDAIIVGSSAPDFCDDPRALAAQLPSHVTKDTVDIVWVGLGSPKQDFVADTIATERGVMTAGVGAAFDFIAGTVREAPKLIQDSGMEWLFRLVSEPRRLWRRYLIGNVRFLRIVLPALREQRSTSSTALTRKPSLGASNDTSTQPLVVPIFHKLP